MKRIFIVGATGYIGSVVAEKFVARGDIVLGLTRSDQKAVILQTRGIKPVRGSMNENSKHRWIKAIYTLADFKRTGILSLRREKRGFVFSEVAKSAFQ